MTKTMEERIMAAADNFGWAMTSWGESAPSKSASEAAREAEACRATLAALVAEACAPQTEPERVCWWTVNTDGAFGACGEIGWGELDMECFKYCPGCGRRVELADVQEVE